MPDSSIEARVRGALAEVADRIDVSDRPVSDSLERVAVSGPSEPRRWVLGAAAVVIAALGVAYGLVSSTGRSDRGVVAGPSEKRQVLIETTLNGERVRLESDRGRGCVHLDLSFDGPSPPPGGPRSVCLKSVPLALGVTQRAGGTLVYGLTSESGELRVTVADDGVAPPVVRMAKMGDTQVFFAFIEEALATGRVEVLQGSGRVVAKSQFEKGASSRPAKQPAGSAKPLLVYRERGAVWARLDDGRTVRLSDGIPEAPDGFPFVSPDGGTIVFTVDNSNGIFDAPSVLDVSTGSIREVSNGGMRFEFDGRLLAGFAPRDDTVDAEISIVATVKGFPELRRFTIPDSADSNAVDVVWLNDGSILIVVSDGLYLAGSDSTGNLTGRLTKLRYDGDPSRLAITEPPVASSSGPVPALRSGASGVELGELVIQGEVIEFNKIAALPAAAGEVSLNPAHLRIDRSRGHLRRMPDGRLKRAEGDSPAYVISDGHNVFQYADGKLSLLLSGVEFASTP